MKKALIWTTMLCAILLVTFALQSEAKKPKSAKACIKAAQSACDSKAKKSCKDKKGLGKSACEQAAKKACLEAAKKGC